MQTCADKLRDPKALNPWYLPTIPTTLLSFNDVCHSYADLFSQMKVKGVDNVTKAVQYSLILTLEMDYNSKEEHIFNECTDSIVKQDPKKYCVNEIARVSDFDIWTQSEIDNMCTAATT